jgi:hypothetical protein
MSTKFQIDHTTKVIISLTSAKETLENEWTIVTTAWQNLKPVWGDPQYIKFKDLFEKMLSDYTSAQNECQLHTQRLEQQIQQAQDSSAKVQSLGNPTSTVSK